MKSNKTILFVVNSLRLSGAGKIVHYLAKLCSEHYKSVHAISLYQDELISVHDSVLYSSLPQNSSFGFLARLKTIRLLRHKINDIKPDVCVAFVSDVAFTARIATLFEKRITFVSAERGDPYTLPRIWKILVSWTYRNSDYCIFQLDKARDFFGDRVKNKSFVIPNPFLKSSNLPPFHGTRKKTIVGAGRFVHEKGFDILIKAFSHIHDHFPDYSLIIYGEGPCRNSYLQLITDLHLEEFVSLPGSVSSVAESVREDGVFVLPSRYEGIPNVLIEVMSMGVPTVSANCSPGGPAFLTNNGCHGLLFPVDDVFSLEKCLEQVLSDGVLQKQLSLESVTVCDLLEPSTIKKKWLSAFAEITK